MTRWVLAAALACGIARGAAAQPLRVTGHVSKPGLRGEEPQAGALVVLHRIADRSAGPIDSVLTDRQGRYRFVVDTPDSTSMYLATSRHAGIAYFAAPARIDDGGTPGEIHVFDTTSGPVRLRHLGRHVVVSAPGATGRREVVEVWELGNDTVVTRIGSASNPAFVVRVPEGADSIRSTQGDFAGAGVSIAGRDVRVIAPVGPGVRQLVVTYELPPGAFPLPVTLPESTEVVEVLLEEAAARVQEPRLQALGAVPSEGRNFLRFLGRDLPPGTFRVEVPAGAGAPVSWPWLVGLGLASLGAVAWALRPRARGAAPGPSAAAPSVSATLAGIEAMLALPELDPAERAALAAQRDALRTPAQDVAPGGPTA